MLIHREALELAALAAEDTDDLGNKALACPKVEGNGHVTATDGTVILRLAAKMEQPGLFDEVLDVDERNARATILLPANAAAAFNAAMKKRKRKKGQATPGIAVSQGDALVKLASSDGITTQRFEIKPTESDKFPDPSKMFKAHVTTFEVVFGVEVLIDVLRVLKAIGAASVRLHFAAEPVSPVRVTAMTEVGTIDGMVMPQRP
ncbi:MAG: hypothetical protein AB7R67_20090 [Vicinamibacterales bacterium]